MRLAVSFSTYHGGWATRGRARSDVARIALLRAVIVCEGVLLLIPRSRSGRVQVPLR